MVNRNFVRLFAAFHFFMLSVSIFNLLPHYLELRGAGEALYGAIAGTAGWTNVLFGLLLGHLADRYSRKTTVFFFVLVGMLGNVVALWAMSAPLETYFIARGLHGMAMGLGMPILSAWTMEVSPKDKRREGLAWLGIAGISANSVGPLTAELILAAQPQPVTAQSYYPVFLTAIGMQLVSLVILLTAENRYAEKEAGVAGGGLMVLMKKWESLPVLLVALSFGGVFGVLVSFGKNYTASVGLAYASVLFSAYSAGAITSRIFITPLTDYLTPRYMIPFGLAGIGISQLILSYAHDYWLLAGSGLLYGLSHGILYPTLFVRFLEFQRPSEMGRGSILFQGSFSAGWGIFPLIGGSVAGVVGFPMLFRMLAALAGIGILFHILSERTRPTALMKQ